MDGWGHRFFSGLPTAEQIESREAWEQYKNELIKYNPDDVEIIGIKDAVLYHKTEGDSGAGALTQTTQFYTAGDWYTLRADSARIKLTNSTGGTKYITGCGIRAKLVYRFSGAKGYLHDSFTNYDDILKNGERLLKLQNNMICNVTQINQLADYWWKVHKNKKHLYQITLPGTRHWYKLGSWYTLQIGGAGEAEYIDSKVRLIGKSVEQSPTTLGSTTLTFYEVEENWKFDSSEVARYIASGIPLRSMTPGPVITVASQYYLGTADFYCDGTADQTEIQEAINWLVNNYGGGTVHLTRGQFNVTAAIELASNIVLEGEGVGTVIEKNCNEAAIKISGTVTNCVVRNMKITKNAADTNSVSLISATGANSPERKIEYYQCILENSVSYGISSEIQNSIIQSCLFTDCARGFLIGYQGAAISNIITGACTYGIIVSGVETRVLDNKIADCTGLEYGIYSPNRQDSGLIHGNSIVDCDGGSSGAAIGIYVAYGKHISIENNTISNLTGINPIGICLDHTVENKNTAVVSNLIKDVAEYGSTHYQAIRIKTNVENALIKNNNCSDNGNVISYGNCEDNGNSPQVDGNLATNTSAVRSDVQEYEGSYSYKITKTNAAGTGASYWFVDNNTTTDMHGTVIKQGSYRLGLWVYVPSTGGPAAAEVSIYISEYDGGWNDVTDTATVQDEWEYLETTVTFDSDTTGFRCGIAFADTADTNEYIYIDNVRLTPMGVGNEHDNNFYDGGTDTIIG